MEIKAADLIKIIDACGKNGVSNFKCGEIEIGFNGFVIQTQKDYPEMVESVKEHVVADPNFELQEKVESESLNAELLMITDPAEYEKLFLEGKLEESETMTDNE